MKKPKLVIVYQKQTKAEISVRLKKKMERTLVFLAEELFPDRAAILELTFCKDPYIQDINREFRGKDKPTDVLSFPTDFLNDPLAPTLGDVVISIDTARRQARVYGVSFEEEMLRLFNHGALHLLGFDHEKVSATERARMKRWEKKLLNL